ncbi:glycosyltransferase [Candidatus Nomurabacteria bacterium]|nr:glycosyltransferase [Candidatus Nomurabacteria bacterium]
MNICFVIDNIFPSHGGIGQTVERFSSLLKERGHSIVMISSKDALNKKGFQEINGIKIFRLRGVYIPFTHGIYYQAIPSKSTIEKILKVENIDVIILVSYTLLGIRMQDYCKKLKIPLILWQHFQPENVTKHIHADFRLIRKFISMWTVFISNRSLEIIVPSEFAKNLLVGYGVKKKIEVISNGIDLDEFNISKTTKGSFLKQYGLEGKSSFLFVGRLMPEKNINILIEAFSLIDFKEKENQDLRLVIVGKGDLENSLRKKVKKLHLEDKVIFTGFIDEKTKKEVYNDCDIFILPSLVELEGIVVLEAMAFGKPIMVAGASGSAAHFLVKEGLNGYIFDSNNSEKLAEKIVSLNKNKEKINRMGEQSLEMIKKYDINKSVLKMEEIIEKILVNSKNYKNLI